ncbi:5-amino-6-(5-phospho-D-ribitylamino)uracil phosphatase YitU [Acidipropionibacterium virtanenii]|uniref:5-amino-6-(5-phospho-D-ribitylamino)uracil phosphatase YitU n=1 Tax=Acidipropionibacterium virtanenii TaxID=2057246 RepID=A0A344UXP4_9ACTN|nr:5-amino-6-(5-phospho-D-ribitylamino)uracil phosphatase YitU [Acidipropionibacterium virtanenii]
MRAMAFDIDGTLAGGDMQVSERSCRVLARLPAAGITPITITGRALPAARLPLESVGTPGYVVGCGGGIAISTPGQDVLFRRPMPPAVVDEVLGIAEEFGLVPTVFGDEELYATTRDDRSARILEASNLHRRVVVTDDLRGVEAIKMMVQGPKDHLDRITPRIKARFPTMHRSLPEFFETSAPGADKKPAILDVLDRIGVEASDCMGFGDGENDVAWLEAIGHPIAMGNARDDVKAVAGRVIGPNTDDGVARFLEDWLG